MSDSTIINIIVTVLAIMVLVLGTGLFLLVKELKWQKACIESSRDEHGLDLFGVVCVVCICIF